MKGKNRSMMRCALLLGAMLCCGLSSMKAQQSESEAKAKTDGSEKTPVAYRMDYSVNELEDGKKINSRQYSINLNAGDANSLKIGTRVPVESEQGKFQYIDLGTNIWCRLRQQASELTLEVRAEISSLANSSPDQAIGPPVVRAPVVRQLQINGSTIVVPGKPMVIGAVDDPNSKRQFQLEVTVSKLR
jgi:hypothetical protein